MTGAIDRRIAALEARMAKRRRYVFYIDETIPPDHRGAYARMPRPFATVEEWIAWRQTEGESIE